MEITVTPYENWQVVAINGKFVMKSLNQATKVFDVFEKENKKFIAIDLISTTHMDSSAINFLLTVYKRIKEKNGQIVLFGANDDITGIIGIVGLESTFQFYKDRWQFEQSLKNNNS